MNPTIPYPEAMSLLTEIVNERPDYQYRMTNGECLYRDPETFEPSCLVGHFLDRSGVAELRTEEFERWEGVGAPVVVSQFLEVDDHTCTLLSLVQEYQDEGLPWGDSLSQAMIHLNDAEALEGE